MNREMIEQERGLSDQGFQAQGGAMVQGQVARQFAEVQAAMVMAKQFPRDTIRAQERIKTSCSRPALAEQAIYAYTRGGSKVSGPSIRLAEVLSQCWGNLEAGVRELDRRPGESTCEAYAWDLETNARESRTFTVRHIRDRRDGNVQLTSERDIYELIANMGARRKRACIIAVMPGDIVDQAEQWCRETLKNQHGDVPMEDRITKMALKFKEDHQVTREMIESFLGHRLEACDEQDLIRMREIYNSLRDKMSTREDWFDLGAAARTEQGGSGSRTDATKERMKQQQKSKASKEPKPEDATESRPESDPSPTSDVDMLDKACADVQRKRTAETVNQACEQWREEADGKIQDPTRFRAFCETLEKARDKRLAEIRGGLFEKGHEPAE